MTDKEREEVALFRFGVINDLVGATRLELGERGRRIKQKAAAHWNIPHSTRTRLCDNTIRRRAATSAKPARWMRTRSSPWCACARPSRSCRWRS